MRGVLNGTFRAAVWMLGAKIKCRELLFCRRKLPPRRMASGLRAGGMNRPTAQVLCDLCPRGCSLSEGKRGFCFVRQNFQGQMVSTTYGHSTGFCIDPIEKKPLNHFYPGSAVLSFGTAGCNLGCKFCQNWEISKSREVHAMGQRADPATVARAARQLACPSVAFTYNDPVVWAEYAMDCAKECRAAGVKTVAVTAGYITPLAARSFFEFIDAANVDLKGFTEDFYREMTNSRLAPVQETLRWLARETDVWLEVTNLLIPGKNDSDEDLKRMCAWFVEALGPDVPLHFTAFHPDFRLQDIPPTPPATLVKAYEIARLAGLHYIYTGNTNDRARQSTYCPQCGQMLIAREGYHTSVIGLEQNRCRDCKTAIAGRFGGVPGDWGPRRMPVRISAYAEPDNERSDALAAAKPSGRTDLQIRPVEEQVALEVCPTEFNLTPQQERQIFEAAGQRVIAAVLGRAARPLEQTLADLASMTVAGAFVTLRRSGRLRSCCGSLGRDVPLSQALDHAAVAAAKDDPRFPPIGAAELPYLDVDVWLLGKLQPVSAKGLRRKEAVIIGKHGLKIARNNLQGLLLPGVAVEHHLDAEDFLEQVCHKAGLPPKAWLDDRARLMTFEGRAVEGELKTLLDDFPQQQAAGPADAGASLADIRLPAAAGTFYPRDAAEINRTLDQWFSPPVETEPWAAALVPHAGWVYSGRLAAEVFSRVKFPKQVIVVAPRHGPEGANWAVAPHRVWQLPGRCLDSDPELAGKLANSIPGLQLDAAAHAREHAIEVQLPLIARLSPQSRIVGITIYDGELHALEELGRQIADVLAGLDERPLLVISSDMNHYDDDAETRRRDRLALEALASLDPTRLHRTVRENRISMCGVLPAVVVLSALSQLHALNRCRQVGYTTSAEASHDTQRCVGYAGLLFA